MLPEGYSISEDRSLIQWSKVHSWLSGSYWSPGVSLEKVKTAAENSSLVLGVYHGREQVGYCRVVSDKATFAWICDVWIDENHRKKGLAKAMIRRALDDPEHRQLRRWILATRDAHPIYAECGFKPLPNPERWMIYVPVAKGKKSEI